MATFFKPQALSSSSHQVSSERVGHARAALCNYQEILDEFCSKMSRDGEYPYKCSRAGNRQMYARYGTNENGQQPGWRCYGQFEDSGQAQSCIGKVLRKLNLRMPSIFL